MKKLIPKIRLLVASVNFILRYFWLTAWNGIEAAESYFKEQNLLLADFGLILERLTSRFPPSRLRQSPVGRDVLDSWVIVNQAFLRASLTRKQVDDLRKAVNRYDPSILG